MPPLAAEGRNGIMKKKLLSLLCFLCLTLLTSCATKPSNEKLPLPSVDSFSEAKDYTQEQTDQEDQAIVEQDKPLDGVLSSEKGNEKYDFNPNEIDYSRLPLVDYDYLFDFTQEQIEQKFRQFLIDTPQTRYIAYRIWLAMGHSEVFPSGDFNGIENAPIEKLIYQAVFRTRAIDHREYPQAENNIVSIVYEEAIKDGYALGDIFYADDIEQTMINLYGVYPIEGESYKNHFKNADLIEYYPEEGLFLQRFDYGGGSDYPLILETKENHGIITCDFIALEHGYGTDNFVTEWDGDELTPKNFIEATAGQTVYRVAFNFADDDGRPLLHQVETIGKLGMLLGKYNLQDWSF
jgi:hypothetical protein